MYLKRLDIKNFRVFDEEGVSLIFNQGVNAIIGENNSGKSSVIDAIRIAYSTVKYSLQWTTQGNGLTGGVPPVRFSM